jgi:hypothetical protein
MQGFALFVYIYIVIRDPSRREGWDPISRALSLEIHHEGRAEIPLVGLLRLVSVCLMLGPRWLCVLLSEGPS